MKTAGYIIIIIVMFAFLLLSPYKWIIIVAIIGFSVHTLIRYLFWRNEFDWDQR